MPKLGCVWLVNVSGEDLGVGDRWEGVADGGGLGGHGEEGGDPEGHPSRHGLPRLHSSQALRRNHWIGFDKSFCPCHLWVNPEGEPGHDDEHAGGHVDGQHVVGELPLQGQVHQQAAVLAWPGVENILLLKTKIGNITESAMPQKCI